MVKKIIIILLFIFFCSQATFAQYNEIEAINKNIEKLEEENMNIITKVVMGIRRYFEETYSDHVFRKVVSMLVVLCFVLNIANLPAYAKSERRAKDNKEKSN